MRHRLANLLVTAAVAAALPAGAGCARDPATRVGSPGVGRPASGPPAGATPASATPAGATPASATPASATPASATPAGAAPVPTREAEVYAEVLRRYLSTPAENSFPGQRFKKIFVLDRAVANSGRPRSGSPTGTTIPAQTRHLVVEALRDLGAVSFIADRGSVIMTTDGCQRVKEDGILITLGPLVGDDKRVQVGLYGFVACLGATWLTYVVERPADTAWRVTGTTGLRAIA